MRVIVNPETQPSADFGYVEAGRYTMRVVGAKEKRKQGGEFPYIEWEFEHADPNVKATDPKKTASHVFDNTTLSTKPKAQFRLRDLCDALGLTWGDFDTDKCIGMEFDAKLVLDEYEDVIKNKIGRYFPKK